MKGKLYRKDNKWFIKEVKTVKNCFGCKPYDIINNWEVYSGDVTYCLDSDDGQEVGFELVTENGIFEEEGNNIFAKLTGERHITLIDSVAITSTSPPNSFIFSLQNNEPVIVIDESGFKYKGELIEDSGEVYRLFKQFLIDAGR